MTEIKATLFRTFSCLALGSGLVLSSACSEYQLTLNETVLRSPEPLYTDFKTKDRNLQVCLDQAIKDHKVTSPDQLKQLNCSHAGIETLEGLEAFHNLTQINLAHNALRDIKAVGKMGRIELLLLDHNQLEEIPEILTLPKLQQLNLQKNDKLRCADIQQLRLEYQGEIDAPKHCL